MSGLNLNKKLWRIPQQGMVRGVCAGLDRKSTRLNSSH